MAVAGDPRLGPFAHAGPPEGKRPREAEPDAPPSKACAAGGSGNAPALWHASLDLQEDPDDAESIVTLRAIGATEDAAKAELAEALHQRVFLQPIPTNATESFNDYDSPLGFLESIRAEGESEEMPESYTAAGVWEALYEALGTLRTVPPESLPAAGTRAGGGAPATENKS